MRKHKIFPFLIILSIIFSGCGSPSTRYPINVCDKIFPEFGVSEIKSSMIPKTVLRHHSWGRFLFLNFKGDPYYAGDMAPEAFQIFTAVAREELKLVGYKTLSQADAISKTRFLIS